MAVAANTFLAQIDRCGVASGLFQPTFPRWPVDPITVTED
jgi:hypothetical protein